MIPRMIAWDFLCYFNIGTIGEVNTYNIHVPKFGILIFC